MGKTSFLEYLKVHQREIFRGPVFFLSQFELDSSPHLRGKDLLRILKKNLKERLDIEKTHDFLLPDQLLEKRVEILSGGEKQLLKLFLTFHFKGDYWILDEPFNHLDSERRGMLEDFIWERLKNILLVDHSFKGGNREIAKKLTLQKEGELLFFSEEKNEEKNEGKKHGH